MRSRENPGAPDPDVRPPPLQVQGEAADDSLADPVAAVSGLPSRPSHRQACRAPNRGRGRSPRWRPRPAFEAPRALIDGAAFGDARDVLVRDPLLVVDRLPGALPVDFGVDQVLGRRVGPMRSVAETAETGLPEQQLVGDLQNRRLWSRRIIAVNGSCGTLGAFDIAIKQLVLAGLPTTSTLTSSAALALISFALRLEAARRRWPSSRSKCSMRGTARPRPDQEADVATVERLLRVVGDVHPAQQREGAVVELHRGALGGFDRLGDLQQAELDRVSGPSICTAGDAEQQRVADLAGGAGYGDLLGGGALTKSSPRARGFGRLEGR